MYYVYVLQSGRDRGIYLGYSTDLKARFAEHTRGGVTSTRYRRPLKLIFYEAYLHPADAKRREKYLKTSKGHTTLKTMLQQYWKDST